MMKALILILLLCLGHCCGVTTAEAASHSHDLAEKVEKLEFLLAKTIKVSALYFTDLFSSMYLVA